MTTIPGRRGPWTRGLLRCGVIAGPAFVAVFLAEGAVRDGYQPLRHPVSSLALGSRGWIQAANFAVAGTLVLAGAAGLARAGDPAACCWAAPILIGAAGAGLIGSAAFTTDPVSGYPPGTPDLPAEPSRAGAAHNLSRHPESSSACPPPRSPAAGGPGGAGSAGSRCTARAPPSPCWALWRWPARASASHPGWLLSGGLFQRAAIISGFAWLSALSARALHD